MQTVHTTVDKIMYRDPDTCYTVFRGILLRWSRRKKTFLPTKESHTFVGYFMAIFLGDHMEVSYRDSFSETYGSHYAVICSKRVEPASLVELQTFLRKNIKGMTSKRTEKLLNAYGLDTMHAIKTDPHALDFLHLPPAATAVLRQGLLDNGYYEDLMVFLQLHDMDCRLARPLYEKYQKDVIPILTDNPYLPYLNGLYGFRIADKLYLSLGKPLDSPKRYLYTVLALLQQDSSNKGNIFTRKADLKQRLQNFLTESYGDASANIVINDTDIDEAVSRLEDMSLVIADNIEGTPVLYLAQNYTNENMVAERLAAIMDAPKEIEFTPKRVSQYLGYYQSISGIQLAGEQQMAVLTALTEPITIISGGPGTGKTQTINTIVAAAQALAPYVHIKAMAPTGMAAIRIHELTGLKATTIHRGLGLGGYRSIPPSVDSLSCDILIVDEFSMADIRLCAMLFQAMSSKGRIIMVGDHNQLPSVGPGLVLRDLIKSNTMPCILLKRIFRQAGKSRIVVNSHRLINQVKGQPISLQISPLNTLGTDGFFFLSESSPQSIIDRMISIIDYLTACGVALENIQIASPIHKGDLGTDHLNYIFQQKYRRSNLSVEYEEKQLFVRDKVVQMQNNYELSVFNGEVGTVSAIQYSKSQTLLVNYSDKTVCYPISAIDQLDLAYALTVHKLQGNEYPVIIMPIHESLQIGLSKNILYTAWTRARQTVILIGTHAALSSGLRRETVIGRESNLVRRLRTSIPAMPQEAVYDT